MTWGDLDVTFDFPFPDVGEGIHEGEILRWRVREGDRVSEDDPLVEVQTDKAAVEIPSPYAGIVAKIHRGEGETIRVGEVLVTLHTDESPERANAALPETRNDRRGERPVLAAPALRKRAREMGIDLRLVTGTGPGGRITDQDLRAYLETRTTVDRSASAAGSPVTGAGAGPVRPSSVESGDGRSTTERRVPLQGIRKQIAENMRRALTVPQATHMDEVDVGRLVDIRRGAQALAKERGVRLTYLPFILKAVAAGLREFPYLNASLDEAGGEIILKSQIHLGIAVDTDGGLVVPVLREVERKSILQLAAELSSIAERARANRLTFDDLRGGTFTVTNIGALGGVFSTPIVYHPQVAILGVHRIRERPVVREGELTVGQVLPLTISFDHRVVDGAYAARFLNRVMGYLEQPSLLFMELI